MNENVKVDFECTGGQFKAIVWRIDKDAEGLVLNAEKLGVNLTVNRIEMLKMIIKNPTITIIEMAQAIGISSTAIDKSLEDMRDKLIRRVGSKKTGLWDVILD